MNNFKYLSIIVIVIVFSACGGVKFRYFTRINADGSIFKRVVAVGDSNRVHSDKVFPFVVADGWEISYDIEVGEKDGKPDTIYLAIAERTFANIDSVKIMFNHKVDTLPKENVSFNHNAKFRWFYTYHTYSETYHQRFPLKHYSIDEFLTAEQQNFFISEDKSILEGMTKEQSKQFEDRCNEQWEKYIGRSAIFEFFNLLDLYSDSIGISRVSQITRDSIQNSFNVFKDEEWDSLCINVDRLENNDIATKAFQEGRLYSLINIFEKADWLEGVGSDYENTIEVPGLMYNTNGITANDHSVKWNFSNGQFAYKDFVMEVQYRMINVWFFIVSGVLAIFLIWLLFRKKN